MRIAVDIGGTFTDLVAVNDSGQLFRSKSLTTPDDLARGIQECLSAATIDVASASFFVHGSTVTINAVLERKGARTGLITTKGFRDVYEIGRGNRPEGYNLFFKRPVPLVPRDLRLEVDERLYATGEVLKPLESWDVNNHTYDASFGTDNFDFLLSGVPNLVANQDPAPYLPEYHAESDVFERVNLAQAKHNDAIAAVLVWGLAERTQRLAPRQTRAELDQLIRKTKLDEQMKAFGQWEAWMAGKRAVPPP